MCALHCAIVVFGSAMTGAGFYHVASAQSSDNVQQGSCAGTWSST